MLMSNISLRSQTISPEVTKLQLCILKGYGGYWLLHLPVRTFSKMYKWHKYLIPVFKFELDLWGNIHHTNFIYRTIRHLIKTNHLGSLYSKRGETETTRGRFSGSDHKTSSGQYYSLSGLRDGDISLLAQVTAWPHWSMLLIHVSLPDRERTPNNKLFLNA